MSYTVSARLAVKRHRCDGWGCGDRLIPLGAFYSRTVEFNGSSPKVSILCERCSERYALCKIAIDQRKMLAET